jgi:hypothetical protein
MKNSKVPATRPGTDSGRVTLAKVRTGPAYRSPAASSRRPSSFSRLAYSGSTMKGRKLYVSPATTATDVASSRPSGARIPTSRSTPTRAPLSDRIVFQASVRTRKLVNIGAMTHTSIRFFQRPAFSAIAYASG